MIPLPRLSFSSISPLLCGLGIVMTAVDLARIQRTVSDLSDQQDTHTARLNQFDTWRDRIDAERCCEERQR